MEALTTIRLEVAPLCGRFVSSLDHSLPSSTFVCETSLRSQTVRKQEPHVSPSLRPAPHNSWPACVRRAACACARHRPRARAGGRVARRRPGVGVLTRSFAATREPVFWGFGKLLSAPIPWLNLKATHRFLWTESENSEALTRTRASGVFPSQDFHSVLSRRDR